VENLYIIQLPKTNNLDTAPEDYFDKETKQILHNGKFFEFPNGSRGELSKASFAYDIVKKNWKDINFDKFKPVYDAINLVIKDYEVRLSPTKD
jgi:hypothetical protein